MCRKRGHLAVQNWTRQCMCTMWVSVGDCTKMNCIAQCSYTSNGEVLRQDGCGFDHRLGLWCDPTPPCLTLSIKVWTWLVKSPLKQDSRAAAHCCSLLPQEMSKFHILRNVQLLGPLNFPAYFGYWSDLTFSSLAK